MRLLRKLLDLHGHVFRQDGPLRRLYPVHEALDTFLFTPGHMTRHAPWVRDGIDCKRLMSLVIVALMPCILMAIWNTGYQANLAIGRAGPAFVASMGETWRGLVLIKLGGAFDATSQWSNVVHGLLWFLPVTIVSYAIGGLWEVVFAVVRKHEISEGFLVTGMLFPLILPPTIPLWQVALGISFGVVLGKEIFGGVGYNILNPALTARAFLFFAYPMQSSGNGVWIGETGISAATPLAVAAEGGVTALTKGVGLSQAFLGTIPGSMGETSTLACLLGAAFLVVVGVGSWRIMLAVLTGTVGTVLMFNAIGSTTNPLFALPVWWHLVLGGWAFGCVFMATDPVTAPGTDIGRWVYGALIGIMVVLVRVVNPAYSEGMMLSILLMNVFAPLIDYSVIAWHVRGRSKRLAHV